MLTLILAGLSAYAGVAKSDGHGGAPQGTAAAGRTSTIAAVMAWTPSPIAFAIGMYVTPNWTVARLIGALSAWAWSCRRSAKAGDTGVIMVATGLVLGEGLAALATAGLAALEIAPWTCMGCIVPGQCGNACSSSNM